MSKNWGKTDKSLPGERDSCMLTKAEDKLLPNLWMSDTFRVILGLSDEIINQTS